MQTVAIAGVGLIGGSFARALRKYGFEGRILGVSSEPTLRRALDLSIIDEGLALREALPRADLVLLANPISRIIEQLALLDRDLKAEAVVTDVGSTKREVVAAAAKHLTRGIFIGGHPMAGKERRGVEHADPDLFRGRTWFLTPSSNEELEHPGIGAFVSWLQRIGAVPVPVSPAEHDRLVSLTSHLPQLLATTLAAFLSESVAPVNAGRAAGPGLHDMTRLAQSDFEIWSDILDTNLDSVRNAVDGYIARLTALRQQLPAGGLVRDAVRREFEIAENFAKGLRKPHT